MQELLRNLLGLYGCEEQAESPGSAHAALYELATQIGTESGWNFGVSEFSLSFGREGRPRVRALAEVLSRVPVAARDEHALRKIGRLLFNSLHQRYGGHYDVGLFADLVHLAYGTRSCSSHPPHLRFGAGLEWCSGQTPSPRCYFDLFAGGRQTWLDRLREVFERLGFGAQWRALARLLDDGESVPVCRIVAMEFSPARERNVRLYLSGSQYTLARIRRLLANCEASDQAWQLDLFNTHVLGKLTDQDLDRTLLLGLVFAEGLPQKPTIKLDGYLPEHHVDDLASHTAVSRLAAALNIPLPGLAEATRRLVLGSSLSDTQRILQYCSLDLNTKPKLNLYFRPLDSGSEHLSIWQRPRLKPELVTRLDHACRLAIAALVPRAEAFRSHAEVIGCALREAALCGFEVSRCSNVADVVPAEQSPCSKTAKAGPAAQHPIDGGYEAAATWRDLALAFKSLDAQDDSDSLACIGNTTSLVSGQGPDGLWCDDVEATALCLRALCRARPFLEQLPAVNSRPTDA